MESLKNWRSFRLSIQIEYTKFLKGNKQIEITVWYEVFVHGGMLRSTTFSEFEFAYISDTVGLLAFVNDAIYANLKKHTPITMNNAYHQSNPHQ